MRILSRRQYLRLQKVNKWIRSICSIIVAHTNTIFWNRLEMTFYCNGHSQTCRWSGKTENSLSSTNDITITTIHIYLSCHLTTFFFSLYNVLITLWYLQRVWLTWLVIVLIIFTTTTINTFIVIIIRQNFLFCVYCFWLTGSVQLYWYWFFVHNTLLQLGDRH